MTENPYPHHPRCGEKPQMCLACIWNEGWNGAIDKIVQMAENSNPPTDMLPAQRTIIKKLKALRKPEGGG